MVEYRAGTYVVRTSARRDRLIVLLHSGVMPGDESQNPRANKKSASLEMRIKDTSGSESFSSSLSRRKTGADKELRLGGWSQGSFERLSGQTSGWARQATPLGAAPASADNPFSTGVGATLLANERAQRLNTARNASETRFHRKSLHIKSLLSSRDLLRCSFGAPSNHIRAGAATREER